MVNAHRALVSTVYENRLTAGLKRPVCRPSPGRAKMVDIGPVRSRPCNPACSPTTCILPAEHRRIHLRIEADGSAMLMVDATDAVHLNPSAAIMVKYALDGRPQSQAMFGADWPIQRHKKR